MKKILLTIEALSFFIVLPIVLILTPIVKGIKTAIEYIWFSTEPE